jgi:hypothetical protein
VQRKPERADTPTLGQLLGEVLDLGAGLFILLLPLLTTALPGIVLLLILPAALLAVMAAVPVAIVAAIVGPPYLLIRTIRRRLQGARLPAA